MNANGMLGTIAAVKVLSVGRYFWMTSVTTPIARDTPTAIGTDVSRAATTAANAAAMSVVMPETDRPLVGGRRMPASPARAVVTAQTPREMRPGLMADSDAIASESTIART